MSLQCAWRWAALSVLLATGAAQAGGFGVSPVRISWPEAQRSTALTVSNGGEETQRIQAEVFRWTRVNGEDVLTPETALLLNPPLFELAPGGTQIVRLGFRGGKVPAADNESAYRVFFQEVPREIGVTGTQLRMVLRVGVPVFVPPVAPKPNLQWSGSSLSDALRIQLRNAGNTHARIANLRIIQEPARVEQTVEGFFYVFPGETQGWTLPGARDLAGGPIQLEALTDAGAVKLELPLQAP